jgi:predicted Fe-Mo cluster-binding NifX family protein
LKVAVSSTGPTLDSPVSPRFGRCPYYLIVDTGTMGFEALPNTNMNAPSGAGIAAAQEVAGKEVEAVLTGRFGPNAYHVLSQVGIKMVTGAAGTVRQAVDAYKGGSLKETSSSTPVGGLGYGRGIGMGRGMGMGRGLGRGMGRGMGRGVYNPGLQLTPTSSGVPASRDEEKEILRQHLAELERELREVRKRLEDLK